MNKIMPHYSRERVMRKYGLTISDYHRMYAEQQGRCPICKDHYSELVINHDHKLNKFRGLICRRCNVMLGMAKDDPQIIIRALSYMFRWMEARSIRPIKYEI